MDAAKNAVKEFMHKAGHNDTTVHERVNPAITHERQDTHKHENLTTAIDKEVHQDHYHTSVQPIKDKQVLPEQHHHNIIPVEHRSHEHGNDADVERRLKEERAKFQDETVKGETRETQSINPVIAGEHKHHHVHETIQPVVQRQTIEPHVVHTTVPIHEVHHNAAQHHSTSTLPTVSLSEFQKHGGSLTGREERYDGFEGEPRSMMGKAKDAVENAATGGHHHNSGHNSGINSGVNSGVNSGINSGVNTRDGVLGQKESPVERAAAGAGRTGTNSTTNNTSTY